MMKAMVLFFVLATSLIALGAEKSPSAQPDLCPENEYFSDSSKKCEAALLQLGLGDQVQSLSIQDLKQKFPLIQSEEMQNPAYKETGRPLKARKYQGFRFKDVIQSLLPKGESISDYLVAITCLDGFDPVLTAETLAKMNRMDALIAIRQVGIEKSNFGLSLDRKWELIKEPWGIISPGPFYLVWQKAEGTAPMEWPFQIKSLRLVKAKDHQMMLKKLEPDSSVMGLEPKSSIEIGYSQFRGKCMTCHRVHGAGGSKAHVDLLATFKKFSSTDQSLAFLKGLVANPPAGMSDIRDIKLSDGDLRAINDYLGYMSKKP